MQMGGGMAMSREQIQAEMARQRAVINSGYKFIELRLLDLTKRNIQGARILNAFPYRNIDTQMIDYKFVEQGGPLNFSLNEMRGGYYAQILDVEWNRKFLASHYDYHYWEIADQMVDAEIAALNRKMKLAIRDEIESQPVEKPENADMSDEDLEGELIKLQAEKLRREQAKRNLQKKRPIRRARPKKQEKSPEKEEKPPEKEPEQTAAEPPEGVIKPQSKAVTLDVSDN